MGNERLKTFKGTKNNCWYMVGIRMALGATKAKVFQLIVRDGLKLAGAGLIAGVIASYFLTRLMSSLLFEVKPADPFTIFF